MTSVSRGVSLKSISIDAFKCFEQLALPLGALTLLTGFNGAGKSSALQPLMLIAQTYKRSDDPKRLSLNGSLVKLGTAGDVTPSSSDRRMKFSISTETADHTWEISPKAGDRDLDMVSKDNLHPNERDRRILRDITYLAAVRLGAEDSFPIPDNLDGLDVGFDGRYAPYWYDRLADDIVVAERLNPKEEATTFRKQLDSWMAVLFPGARVSVQSVVALSLMNLQFALGEYGDWRRPSNIGYGLTYAFPILVALLGATPGQVIVVDSPEAHLHPSAQSMMGRLLAHFANAGVQIIVETHSDHLLSGIRLAVREKVLSPQKLNIHFFGGASEGGHGVISPTVGADGEIYEWPNGFFDQGEKDLAQLAGWN